MAHLNDGTLRRMVDDPDAIAAPDRAHFAGCATCKARFDQMDADAKSASALLAAPEPEFDANAAYRRVTAQPARPRFGLRLPILRPASRAMVAAVALVVLVAVGVTASVNVGEIFKPQTVQPVSVSVLDIQSLPDLANYGDFKFSQEPSPQIGISKADAEKVAGFSAPAAKTLPSGVPAGTNVTYGAMSQVTATFTFDAAKAQAAAAANGKTLPAMPAGMNGSTLTMVVGPVIVELYGNLPAESSSISPSSKSSSTLPALPRLVIAASKAPVVTSTGVTTKQLEDYMLEQPGITPGLAADIRAIGDPTHTLVIPVPVQYATSKQVTVHGVQGVALGDNTGLGSAVIWIKNGIVYFVGGSLKQDEAVSVANALS
jgi:hypothetical protein